MPLSSAKGETNMPPRASAVVVGAGPGGVIMMGSLLEELQQQQSEAELAASPIAWVDPDFTGGRINSHYRAVPSNTSVKSFIQFAEAAAPFREIIQNTPAPNAMTALQDFPDQNKGCDLGFGADLCLMLSQGLSKHRHVRQHQGTVVAATLNKKTNLWTVTLDNSTQLLTPNLILCTGSSPITNPLPILTKMSSSHLEPIPLDTILCPTKLSKALPPTTTDPNNHPTTIAVIGASHSAILVLMNLCQLAQTTHPNLKIKWFTRNKLRYAEKMEGWTLFDNTGLKEKAAEWAREHLEGDNKSNILGEIVTKCWTSSPMVEDEVYEAELPNCTHVVQAVGYKRDEGPRLEVEGEEEGGGGRKIDFDHDTGRFFSSSSRDDNDNDKNQKEDKKYVPGLFGGGIAYPERVTDPYGNVEHAVGFWKFMRTAKKEVPRWLADASSC